VELLQHRDAGEPGGLGRDDPVAEAVARALQEIALDEARNVALIVTNRGRLDAIPTTSPPSAASAYASV
jgi:hypothetical protein